MPKTIVMPSSPNFANSTFALQRAVAVSISPFTGKQRTQEYDSSSWSCSVVLPAMRRTQAALWQSFLLSCKGPANTFLFIDPDAAVPQGTYNESLLRSDIRCNDTSETLSFSGKTITAATSVFTPLIAGDFFFVTGAANDSNNGTHKIVSKTSATVVVTSSVFTTEANKTGCTVRQNVKGAEALSLDATTNAATGTIKAGDYLAIFTSDVFDGVNLPVQLVMCTEDATLAANNDTDHYSVAIQPKLRADLANNHIVGFAENFNRGLFRLAANEVEWTANAVSTYTGIAFEVAEVV